MCVQCRFLLRFSGWRLCLAQQIIPHTVTSKHQYWLNSTNHIQFTERFSPIDVNSDSTLQPKANISQSRNISRRHAHACEQNHFDVFLSSTQSTSGDKQKQKREEARLRERERRNTIIKWTKAAIFLLSAKNENIISTKQLMIHIIDLFSCTTKIFIESKSTNRIAIIFSFFRGLSPLLAGLQKETHLSVARSFRAT